MSRPSWDDTWMKVVNAIAERSNDEIKVETREEAIIKFESWLLSQPELVKKVKSELKGKVLGCWCRPWHACHGDVLARIANEETEQ